MLMHPIRKYDLQAIDLVFIFALCIATITAIEVIDCMSGAPRQRPFPV
jgi:hypothetical protein